MTIAPFDLIKAFNKAKWTKSERIADMGAFDQFVKISSAITKNHNNKKYNDSFFILASQILRGINDPNRRKD